MQAKKIDQSSSEMPYFRATDAAVAVTLLTIHAAGYVAVRNYNDHGQNLLWLWIVYECCLLFTHLPFPFTRNLYHAADWLYTNVNVTLFWGMEALSAMFGYFVAGAPAFVLINAATHGRFLIYAYQYGTDTTQKYYSDPTKPPIVNVAISFDNVCHIICLWNYLRLALGADASTATTVAVYLVFAVLVLTSIYHNDEMKISHFLHYTECLLRDTNDFVQTNLLGPLVSTTILHSEARSSTARPKRRSSIIIRSKTSRRAPPKRTSSLF